MKICKQCGESKKQVEYRPYYNGGTSRYKVCKSCEKINSRRKYLQGKLSRTQAEDTELDLINELYVEQRKCGLAPPEFGKRTIGVTAAAEQMMSRIVLNTEELTSWLEKDLQGYHPDELSNTYDALKLKYMPQIRIDQHTFLPVYDETYATVLSRILTRFDDYEEDYYELQ